MSPAETTPELSAAIEQHIRQDSLGFAVRNDFLDKAEAAIDDGADPNILHPSGKTFLTIAIGNNCMEMVSLLINKGADLEMTDNDGNTALSFAVENNNHSIARLLVERGADVPDGLERTGNQTMRDLLGNAPTLRADWVEAARHAASVAAQARLRARKPRLTLKPGRS